MDASRLFIIVNPTAANGRAAERWARFEPVRPPATVAFTTPEVGAGALVHRAIAEECGTLLVCGGDGTVNESVSALLEAPPDCRPTLGVLSAGTSNDFARAVDNADWGRVLEAASQGGTRAVDVGIATGSFGRRCFLVAAFLGTPAEVAGRANQQGKRFSGLAGYLPYLGAALRFGAEVSVECAELSRTGPVRAVVVTNTPNGGGLRVCPDALINDGLLDVLVVDKRPGVGPVRLIWGIARGRHLGLPGVRYVQTDCVTLSGPGVDLALDGEIVGTLPVQIEVKPGALNVVAP